MRNWNVNCLLQNNKSLGINMNIVSNVGQMFMFVWVAFCITFGDVFGCCRAKVFVHRFVSSSRSVGPRPA